MRSTGGLTLTAMTRPSQKERMGSIGRFILFIGPCSSIFDYTTFLMMLYVFKCWPVASYAGLVERLAAGGGVGSILFAPLGAAAVQQMETDHEWYRSLSAENRSWVGLVAQAGITSFLDWFGGDQAQLAGRAVLASRRRKGRNRLAA